jgi:hypothetical protein
VTDWGREIVDALVGVGSVEPEEAREWFLVHCPYWSDVKGLAVVIAAEHDVDTDDVAENVYSIMVRGEHDALAEARSRIVRDLSYVGVSGIHPQKEGAR